MSSIESLNRLRTLDPAILTDVVRRDQRDPGFEITHWDVRRLSDRGFASGDGPFCFYGEGGSGPSRKSWSVVLKICTTAPDILGDTTRLGYRQRECLAYQSGMLDALPAALAVPRYYAVSEQADGTWLWLEHIAERTGDRWTLDDFCFAAYELGRFGAEYALGRQNPVQPWLSLDALGQWLRFWTRETTWTSSVVQKVISPQTRARVLDLWDSRERLIAALDHLPQVFSHGDVHRRNYIIRKQPDGSDELVAVDWAWCGLRPFGSDLGHLVGWSSAFYDWDPADIRSLERVAESAYLAGLRDAGWHGDPRLVRLALTSWIALWQGVTIPHCIAHFATEEHRAMLRQQFDRSPDEFAQDWAKLCDYALDRADEAVQLMSDLKMG
jgi:hypothetical protein